MSLTGAIFVPHPPIIIPEVGQGAESESVATIDGMKKAAKFVYNESPDVIIVITPHGNIFSNAVCILYEDEVHGDLKDFGHREVKTTKYIDMSVSKAIAENLTKKRIDCVLLDKAEANNYNIKVFIDHGAMIPFYYIDNMYQDKHTPKIVHITIGAFSIIKQYEIGMIISDTLKSFDKKAIIVASGDLSHRLKETGPYGFNKHGPEFDNILVTAIKNNEFERILNIPKKISSEAGECGLFPYTIALGAFEGTNVSTDVFSYEGPFGVGYMCASLKSTGQTAESIYNKYESQDKKDYFMRISKEDDYISLARNTIERYVKYAVTPDWNELSGLIKNPREANQLNTKTGGAFVSIHKHGELRGCIGTISATQPNIANEIIKNAVSAASNDPRFEPVTEDELFSLEIKVDILGEYEKINSADELDTKKYGVIVESKNKRGLLLPNLEGIETVQHQVSIAKQKAGIKQGELFTMYRFEVERHEII